MKISWTLLVTSAIIAAVCAIPAQATVQQLNQTWVSATGSDSNPCTITSLCASFQGALANTAAGGEIDCLTPGDFGGASGNVTIQQSVSIVCDGVSNGGILSSNTTYPAVYVDAPNAVVYLSGLDLEGAGTASQGVGVGYGSTVHIAHCTIRGFTEYGVLVSSGVTTRVVIKDSIIVSNATGAAVFASDGGNNALIIVNTVIDGSLYFAARANADSGPSSVALARTLLTGSPTGLNLQDGASGVLIGPSNTIAGAIDGSPTSAPFK